MHPMRSIMLLLEQDLGRSVIWKAAAYLRSMIDWSGGDGETIYYEVRRFEEGEYSEGKLPEEYRDGVNTARFKRLLRAWSIDSVQDAYYMLRHRVFTGNTVKVWREITAPPNWKLDPNKPGLYWSWDEQAAEAHWGQSSGGHVDWLICGEIEFQNVDWPPTLAANAHPSYEDEKEIRLMKGRPVTILSVTRRASRFG